MASQWCLLRAATGLPGRRACSGQCAVCSVRCAVCSGQCAATGDFSSQEGAAGISYYQSGTDTRSERRMETSSTKVGCVRSRVRKEADAAVVRHKTTASLWLQNWLLPSPRHWRGSEPVKVYSFWTAPWHMQPVLCLCLLMVTWRCKLLYRYRAGAQACQGMTECGWRLFQLRLHRTTHCRGTTAAPPTAVLGALTPAGIGASISCPCGSTASSPTQKRFSIRKRLPAPTISMRTRTHALQR